MKNSRYLIALFLSSQIALLGLSSHAAEPNSYAKGLQAELAGDYQAAIAHYEKSANTGLSDASLALGRTYKKLGDHSTSMEWLLKAANAGNAFAQYEVGLIYLNGSLLVATDLGEAARWFGFAAKSKHGEASYELFKLSNDAKWLRQAGEQGVPSAMRELSNSYQLGLNGLEVNIDESDRWSQRLTQSLESEGVVQ